MHWPGVGVFFIALACRKMHWCGTALSLDTPAGTPVTLSPALSRNGISSKHNPSAGISFSSVVSETSPKTKDKVSEKIGNGSIASFHSNKYLECESSSKTDCNINFVKEESNSAQEMPSSDDVAPKNCDENSSERANSMEAEDCDSDISITDVTNDLISTYHYETKSFSQRIKNLQVAAELDQGRQSVKNCDLPTGDGNSCLNPSENVNHISEVGFENVSDIDNQLIINPEEGDTEDDVRSLYPDVVVISSSEEELYSRRSSIADNSFGGKVDAEQASTEAGLKDNVSINYQSNDLENKTINEESMSSEPVLLVPIKPLAHPTVNLLESKSEVVYALRKNSFVEKLEKIISAQTLKFKPASHPSIPKPMSISPEINFTNLQNISSDVANIGASSQSVSSDCSVNLSESIPENSCPSPVNVEQNMSIQVETKEKEWDGTNDPEVVKDIKERLEKIFSSTVNSPVTSPTSKAFSYSLVKPPEEETLVENEQACEKCPASAENNFGVDKSLEENGYASQVDETRKHMAQVLGTLRLRNPDISSC